MWRSTLGSIDSTHSLHDRVRWDLAQYFTGLTDDELGALAADFVIRQGKKVAVVEVKTGDPELPLPSSTSAQMHQLAMLARQKFGDDLEIVPVLVTNYPVTQNDRKELEDEAIKIVPIASGISLYNPHGFCQDFAQIVGLEPKPAASEASL